MDIPAAQARLGRKVGCHPLRHSVATLLPEHGVHSRARQEPRGHAAVQTTAMYTHGMAPDTRPGQSPLDRVQA